MAAARHHLLDARGTLSFKLLAENFDQGTAYSISVTTMQFGPGPSLGTSSNTCSHFFSLGKKTADALQVSVSIIQRRRREFERYSDITDDELDQIQVMKV